MSTITEPQRQGIASVIADTPVSDNPFPHIFARDVLPPELLDWMLGHWPDDFERDPGEIDRSNFLLRGHDGGQRDDPEWQAFTDSFAQQIVDSALAKFSIYNDARFGEDATYSSQIQLLECGPEFAGHPSHSHHNHGPGWAMTFLLYLDDGDRMDRGEVLSAPRADADWLDIVAQNAVPVAPVKSVPFEPNSLIAWLDGPMSFHGTDKLSEDPINRRKMLRCHVVLEEPKVVQMLGVGSLDFLAACRAHAGGESAQLQEILDHPNSCVSAIPRFTFAD